MIYTDGVHLISDCNQEELHHFAQKIGLKREWFQDNPRHPHYDILSNRIRRAAIRSGAKMVDRRQLARIAKEEKRNKRGI